MSLDAATGAITIRVLLPGAALPSPDLLTCTGADSGTSGGPGSLATDYPACPYGTIDYAAQKIRLRVRHGTGGSEVYNVLSEAVKIKIEATPTCPAGNVITSTIVTSTVTDPAKVFVADYYVSQAEKTAGGGGTWTPAIGTGGTRYQSGYWHADFG